MRVSATWVHSSLRTLVLGALLVAAWIILGATSAHASEPLPPLTDAVPKISGHETSLVLGTQTSGAAAEETVLAEGPVAALLEPAATIAEPLAPPAQQIVDPELVPVDAALAPAAAPVASVINHAAQVAGPLTEIAAEALIPVTSTVADITVPVTGTLAEVVAPATAAVGSIISNPVVAPSDDKTIAAPPAPTAAAEATKDGGAATEPPVLSGSPSIAVDVYNMRRPLPDQTAFPLTTARASSPEMQTQNPAPDLPNAPGPGSPATAPTNPGSSFRAASDAGSGFADRLAGFQLSLTRSSLTELFLRSDDLPGSVSLEQGFSPD